MLIFRGVTYVIYLPGKEFLSIAKGTKYHLPKCLEGAELFPKMAIDVIVACIRLCPPIVWSEFSCAWKHASNGCLGIFFSSQ